MNPGKKLFALMALMTLAAVLVQTPPSSAQVPPLKVGPTGQLIPKPALPQSYSLPSGQTLPQIAPNPGPPGINGRCPPGYMEPKNTIHSAHLVVCVVAPTLSQSAARCLNGFYACGRAGTECCSGNNSNMCFAGAYACRASASGTGPKTACCMTR
jgi:hypothetical protein